MIMKSVRLNLPMYCLAKGGLILCPYKTCLAIWMCVLNINQKSRVHSPSIVILSNLNPIHCQSKSMVYSESLMKYMTIPSRYPILNLRSLRIVLSNSVFIQSQSIAIRGWYLNLWPFRVVSQYRDHFGSISKSMTFLCQYPSSWSLRINHSLSGLMLNPILSLSCEGGITTSKPILSLSNEAASLLALQFRVPEHQVISWPKS